MTLRPERLAISSAFFVQGLLFITLTLRLPVVQDLLDLSALALSGIMLMLVLLAGAGSVVAETLARHFDSARTLRLALVIIAVGFVLIAMGVRGDGSLPVFAPGVAVYGLGLGANDAASNMQAVALEHQVGRPVMPSFHAAWTAGGLLATGLAFVPVSFPVMVGALTLAPLAVLATPLLRRAIPGIAEPVTTEELGIPWSRILLVGVALILFYMVDTSATAWGPVYLSSPLVFDNPPTNSAMFALATLPYLAATLLARLFGDALTTRLGARTLVRAGSVLAFIGLAIIVFAPRSMWQIGILGFFVVGLGVAVIAPLAFSAAARIASETSQAGMDDAAHRARVDAVIARFNQFNYVGALLGAVLTGAIGSGNLRIGYAVPMVLILAMLPLARHFVGPRAPAPVDSSSLALTRTPPGLSTSSEGDGPTSGAATDMQ
ncbi:MAG: MFS transporter [Knoellia sp.]